MPNHADLQVWKAKYELLDAAHKGGKHLFPELQNEGGAAPAAAPGVNNDQPDPQPFQGNVNILVGPPQPNYASEVDITVSKTDEGEKAKPFVKIVCESSSHERAKGLEEVFKSNIKKFL